jgi:hypothetical protein
MLPPSIVNDAGLLQADATCSTPEVAESIHPSRWRRIKRTDHKDTSRSASPRTIQKNFALV